jgi:plasmid stability protein
MMMPDVLVRELDDRDLELLRRRAQASGRSLQAELKRILETAARASDDDASRALAEEVSVALAGRPHPDSADLIRADRDR